MKYTRLAITLAALTTAAGCAFAQNEDTVEARSPVAPTPASAPRALAEQERQLAAQADHMREMERAVAASQKAVQLAQTKVAVEAARAPKAVTISGFRKGSVGRALIIPKDPTDAKGLAEVEEDMNVMAHILDKAASEDRKSSRAMGIPVFGRLSWGGSSPQNLFIEGSGALFFLNVNYPLQPAPDKDAAAETKEKPVSEWDNAKKEMAGSGGGSGADSFFAFGESFEHSFGWDSGSSSPYDADKVEELKSDLIAALKNATNIRKLKADDTVTVVVLGTSALAGGKTIKGKPDDKAARLREEELAAVEGRSWDRAPTPAKLVLRVRKADAESFQNGKLNPDEFKKKVTVMVY
jgi:hypothetical protein